MSLTAERLREVLDYNPETGDLVWRRSTGRRAKVGEVAGAKHCKGYLQVTIDGKNHLAHRLVWLHVHGELPHSLIDHVNGDKADNQLANLRPATNAQNLSNRSMLNSNNTSGHRGVCWARANGKWRAEITSGTKSKHIGYFDTADEAATAYRLEAVALFGEFYQQIQAS